MPRADAEQLLAKASLDGAELEYVEPDELRRELDANGLPLEPVIVRRFSEDGVDCADVRFVSELHEGGKVHMRGWLCRPAARPGPLPPLLVVPGGKGQFADSRMPRWLARKTGVALLAVDWIGAGRSDGIPGLDPWLNAVQFDGDDYRASYQLHNLRGLARATELLLSQPFVDAERLMALGSSWGAFYVWLLAGLDARFRHLFVTYGCGFLDTECRQVWESAFAAMGPERAEVWLRAFDPGRRAHLIGAEVFFQQATNDRFYSLVSSMQTFDRVRTRKRLLLARNQDHFTHPYQAQDVELVRAVVEGTVERELPALRDARWVPGTNLVEVEAEGAAGGLRLSVVWSAGAYTTAFARPWRSASVSERDGRLVAEIPVVDPARELWFYAHAEAGDPPLAASTPVKVCRPAAAGLERPTAEFEPSFEFGDEFWALPVGDRQHPAMRLVEDGGGPAALAMRFDGDEARRGVAYCLEGDLIAARGFNGIEARVRVPDPRDVEGLCLCVVTDLHALAELVHVVPLSRLGSGFDGWQRVRVPFAELEPRLPRRYLAYEPPLRPLDVSRICAVGFYHADRSYRGEALLAGVRALELPDAPRLGPVASEPLPWPPPRDRAVRRKPRRPVPARRRRPRGLDPYDLFVPTELPPDELRARLQAWAPWRHELVFSNGVRTSELSRAEPFVEHPLAKWHVFGRRLPEEALRGGRALDVGSNIGHYSLLLRERYGMEVLGLELNPRNLEVGRFLAELSGLDGVEFRAEDAERFRDGGPYDLVLHLGTLDHMRNPFLALESTASVLAPDGYLALELQTYVDPGGDELVSRFVPGRDHSCWWFLGKEALLAMLRECGLGRVDVISEWASPDAIGPDMRRLHLLAQRM